MKAAELALLRAKILHPASIWPAQQFNVPVKLLTTHAARSFWKLWMQKKKFETVGG